MSTNDAPYGYALGVSDFLGGVRLTLVKRIVVGSWRKANGTRGENFGWWCTYDTKVCGVPMMGFALVNETELIRVMRWPERVTLAEAA